ncbi:MAG: coproporphyrinogen dehydrogenase HemZ [Firmicutes bacterium]|nr:coproporphyrinogen dehydrogenase HemZ [Bacillota bacterium]
MLVIELDRENFEYDAQAFVKAFFPEEQVEVLLPESRADKREKLSGEVKIRVVTGERQAEVFISPKLHSEGALADPRSRTCSIQKVAATDGGSAGGPDTFLCYRWEQAKEKSYKEGFKEFFYRTLSEITGRQLPWGMLTGIRPTKIAYGMLEEGRSRQEILEHYCGSYFVSSAKAELAATIAERERRLLAGVHYEDGYSLYIGIPFCPTTCLYCSFTSYPIAGYQKRVDGYLDCLLKEAEDAAGQLQGKILDSVYIGGGTPTTLEPEQLDRLLSGLKELFDFGRVQEFTVEAGRADSITEEKLKTLYRHGVTRISVNPQTMKQETLELIGRRASVEQVEAAYALARRVGFDNINMDIILGLPGEGPEDVQRTIDRLTELSPDSLTVHSLAVKRASGLNRWIQENGTSMLRNTEETMAIAAKGAKRLGMAPYYLYRQKNMSGNFENVGYAREGKFGLYNILIMEEMQSIVALGAGSISKRVYPDGRIERSENVKDVALYMEKIDEMMERKRRLLGDF